MKLRITTLIGAPLMSSANIAVALEPSFPPSDLPSFDLTDLEQRATASQQN